MRVENNHAHAFILYKKTDWRHFFVLLFSIYLAKKNNYSSLTTHLPFEIQHPKIFSTRLFLGKLLISFGELTKKTFHVTLYWENCPIFNINTWDLKYGQTEWKFVPTTISLCLDTGHLIMGSKTKKQARKRIETVLQKRSRQIKHLHIHENNFVSDQHIDPRKRKKKDRVISKELLQLLQKNRTYIFEKQS